MREKGSFGKATVFYEIYNRDCNLSLTNNISTSHFSNSSGRVDFVDRQPLADLILIILEDDIPEFHVCYCIDLVRVTGNWDLYPDANYFSMIFGQLFIS